MELIALLRVLRRWLWFIAAVVIVTALVIWLRARAEPPIFQAEVVVQLTSPQRDDVSTFDEYRYVSSRDEITVARNNFTELLNSQEVIDRTVGELDLTGDDLRYTVDAQTIRDVDYVNVTVSAAEPNLAARIANTHVAQAIAYYGELRAKPTMAERQLFDKELQRAGTELLAAEDAFAQFRIENHIGILADEIATNQRLLGDLQQVRDQHALEAIASNADSVAKVDDLIAQRQSELEWLTELSPIYAGLREDEQQAKDTYQFLKDNSFGEDADDQTRLAEEQLHAAENALINFQTTYGVIPVSNQVTTYEKLLEQLMLERDRLLLAETGGNPDQLAEIDKLIAQRRDELNRLTGLSPSYGIMEGRVQQALAAYQHIASKYNEADLKANAVLAANSLQVTQPAQVPDEPVSDRTRLLVVGVVGSLGLGIMLALLLDYISAHSVKKNPVSAGGRSKKAPAGPTGSPPQEPGSDPLS